MQKLFVLLSFLHLVLKGFAIYILLFETMKDRMWAVSLPLVGICLGDKSQVVKLPMRFGENYPFTVPFISVIICHPCIHSTSNIMNNSTNSTVSFCGIDSICGFVLSGARVSLWCGLYSEAYPETTHATTTITFLYII